MANETYNVVIGLKFQENSAVSDAVAARERLRAVFNQISAETARVGVLDPKQIERFAAQLRTAVKEAFNLDVSQSGVMQALRANTQTGKNVIGSGQTEKAILSAAQTPSSRFAAEQIRVFLADLNKAAVDARSQKQVGGDTGGYATTTDRTRAQAQAALRVELANRQLERAIQKDADQIQKDAARQASDAQRNRDAINKAHYARIQAEDKLARVEEAEARAVQERAEAAQAADARARQFTPSFADARPDTDVGRARTTVNNAERALEVANLALGRTRATEGRTAEQLIAAERRVEAASAALAGARERLTRVEARSADSGLLSQFHTGFKGQSDRPYAEQIGQALKFSLFYGTAYKLLFAFTQTLQQTLTEGIQFQQALTELRLSAGDANDHLDELANRLGKSAAEAGFAPSQGVLVGARSLGLYGATQATAGEQEKVAEISARVVSRLALSSGQQPADLQTNIAAIAQAFGGGAEAQFRIADIDAYMAHRFGIAPGSTIQAVSEAGTVGRAAGFSLEEVNAITADLISRTGDTAPAVAGFMAQIFSRGGEGSLTAVAGRYGIDPTLELADQIKQLADVYKTATPQERAQLSAAFGRGKVQNAAIALLQDYGEVQSAAGAARGGAATGAADQAFLARMGNIGGQIAATTGVLREFANQLGQTGILDLLGLGIVVLRELVDAGTGLLRVWNSLDRGVRDVVLALAVLATTAKLAGGATFAEGMLGRAGIVRAAAGEGRLMAPAAGGMIPLASGAGLRAGFGAIAASLLNPATLAIGGLLAVGALKNTSDGLRDAQKFATTVLNESVPGPGATADDYRSRAAALNEAAAAQRDAVSGLFNNRVALVTGQYTPTIESAQRLESQAQVDQIVAGALDRWSAEAAAARPVSAITSFDAASLSDSMQLITDTGGTAEQQFRALADAIAGTGDSAKATRESFDAGKFGVQSAEGILGALTGALSGVKNDRRLNLGLTADSWTSALTGTKNVDVTDEWIRDTFDPASVMRSVRERFGKTNLAKASDTDLTGIATGILQDSGLDLSGDDLKKAQAALVEFLKTQRGNLLDVLDGAKALTGPQVNALIDQLVSISAERLNALQDTDLSGRLRVAQQLVRNILATIAKGASDATPRALAALANARRQMAESQIDQLEAMRKVAQQNATGAGQVASIGRRYLGREIRAAVRGGAQDRLVGIVATAGTYAKQLALDAVDRAIAVAQAAAVAADVPQQMRNAMQLMGAALPDLAASNAEVKQLQSIRDALLQATHGTRADDPYLTGGDVPGLGASAATTETAAERAAALASANAVRSESQIASARADIQGARAAMTKAKAGTVEYYNALSSYYAARNSLTDAILEYRNNQMLLGIDMTDPLAQARVALRAARQKLASDRGKGADVIAADQVAVRNAEAAREATAFQQRLDSVTTADQLGRISHQKYLKYLNSEHDRLESIKHRTFQQQQELDQIDGLLKEAASSMQAQWNFGDIKLPTPYQVRRYVESRSPDLAANASRAGSAANQGGDTTIYIDGADTGKVKRIIEEVTGKSARTRTSTPRRR